MRLHCRQLFFTVYRRPVQHERLCSLSGGKVVPARSHCIHQKNQELPKKEKVRAEWTNGKQQELAKDQGEQDDCDA